MQLQRSSLFCFLLIHRWIICKRKCGSKQKPDHIMSGLAACAFQVQLWVKYSRTVFPELFSPCRAHLVLEKKLTDPRRNKTHVLTIKCDQTFFIDLKSKILKCSIIVVHSFIWSEIIYLFGPSFSKHYSAGVFISKIY
jgi:hypothetical protein